MFEATARMKIRDGELEGFKRHAAEVMRLMKEQDTKPLRYDWFISDDGTECEVREAYVDADTMLEHQRSLAEAKGVLFREFAADHEMTFYGELSPALAQVLEVMNVEFTRFSSFQVLDEVPA